MSVVELLKSVPVSSIVPAGPIVCLKSTDNPRDAVRPPSPMPMPSVIQPYSPEILHSFVGLGLLNLFSSLLVFLFNVMLSPLAYCMTQSHTGTRLQFKQLADANIRSAPVYDERTSRYIGFLDVRDLMAFIVCEF